MVAVPYYIHMTPFRQKNVHQYKQAYQKMFPDPFRLIVRKGYIH